MSGRRGRMWWGWFPLPSLGDLTQWAVGIYINQYLRTVLLLEKVGEGDPPSWNFLFNIRNESKKGAFNVLWPYLAQEILVLMAWPPRPWVYYTWLKVSLIPPQGIPGPSTESMQEHSGNSAPPDMLYADPRAWGPCCCPWELACQQGWLFVETLLCIR